MHYKLGIISLIIATCYTPISLAFTSSEYQIRAVEYQQLLNELVKSDHIPGAVLLAESPKGRFIGSAGYSDKINKIKMPTNAVMPNGSAGKKLTALLVAMLHEEGTLDLDAPISRYLDEKLLKQIEYSEKMTLRKLLNHTSGIFEYNDAGEYDFYKAQFSQPEKVTTDIFPLKFALNQPAEFEPDYRFGYSNTGYALTGLILEGILGEHPAKEIRKRILTPLEMDSSFIKGVEKQRADLISGYFINTYESSFPLPLNVWVDTKKIIGTTGTMDGPLAANADDMVKLLKAIVKDNDVVSRKVRDQMIGNSQLVNSWGARFYRSSDFYYGLGVWKEIVDGKTFYHHGGTEFGYFTQNIYIPEGDVSITAFANCGVNDHCEDEFQAFTFEVLDSILMIRESI